MLTGVRNFLQRVQHGQVLRWVLAYFAASWFVYQVISLLVHNLELPTVILKVSTIMLVVGGLIAAVLAYYQGARSLPQITGFEALLLTSILVVLRPLDLDHRRWPTDYQSK